MKSKEYIDTKEFAEIEKISLVIDARSKSEYQTLKSFPNSINIPYEDLISEPEKYLADKNKLIIIYCNFGNRSTKKIKPIYGVKIFFQETDGANAKPSSIKTEAKKYSATIYPQNNKGYKEVLQKLFFSGAPNDRVFSLNYVLSNLSKNCLIVFEAQKPEEIKQFAEQWILATPIQKEWQGFLAKISLNPSPCSEKINKAKKENSLLTLKSKCWQKLLTLSKGKDENYRQTLEKELTIIEDFNYIDYFLIFSDAVNYLRSKEVIIGPGRGSAVSSLAAYLLNITSVDPLQHNLFFERFLNEKRKTMPDIDLDIENQEEIFNYLPKKYPKNQVARIITKKKIGWKLALQEKVQDLHYDTSLHPAGVIIAENSLLGLVPLRTEKDYLIALFEENKLGCLGLKKYDFLSLKETLGFIQQTRKILAIELPGYQELDTLNARNLFSRFCPSSFAELVLFLSLNRPGVRKKAEEIIRKKFSSTKSPYSSVAIKKILAETYGFIIFEEQISQILALVYDCSFAEAEVKRRELATKSLESNFLTQAQKKLSPGDSKLIYQQIISSTGYTFNKAHAVAYSYLTYYIAYLKANYFPGLITYFLNNKKEKNLSYLQEAFFYDFQIEKPDINYSQIN
ncbi:10678_t:CDS:2 [Entrophospora sp. SA101]|nr:10678_t:CDS:2 [Entrophospora sp. SA101]